MLENMKKIAVVGGSGTGKTTLTNNLGRKLNLPIYHIDGIHHLENWKARDTKERDSIILKRANEERWVIDGTYKSTLQERINKADLVIFLDYSTILRLNGILSRYLKNKGKEKPEIPGCKEKMDWNFIKMVLTWRWTKGKEVKKIIMENKDKKILVFKNRRSLNKWYFNEFKEKMEL